MKLFGGKKGDDKPAASAEDSDFHDSPVETVSLSEPKAAPAARVVEEEPRTAYGIDQAIVLMRALPVDQNVELVVQVIKTTLESLRVRVSDIIQDASRKQQDLEGRVSHLKREIADFEKEIAQRKDTIAKLEADHAETTAVKGRLELAEKAQKAQVPKAAGVAGAKT